MQPRGRCSAKYGPGIPHRTRSNATSREEAIMSEHSEQVDPATHSHTDPVLRRQLEERRRRLEAVPVVDRRPDLVALIERVDDALRRMDEGCYGECCRCDGTVERERLLRDPLVTVCLECLTDKEARALERDLAAAAAVQQALLPCEETAGAGWTVRYRYLPHGPVGGDHCDVIPFARADGSMVVTLGDVSGKGISASLVAAQLHPVVRGLASRDGGPAEWIPTLNHLLLETTLPSFYVTLTLALLKPDGRVEMVNAGHNPARVVRPRGVTAIGATGLPLGLFRDAAYEVERFDLAPGDLLVLHTDGLTEATDRQGEPFGDAGLENAIRSLYTLTPADALESILETHERFVGGTPAHDDVTVLLARRS